MSDALLQALKAAMSATNSKIKPTNGTAERGDHKFSWRFAGPLAQMRMDFESETTAEGFTHTVTKGTEWVTVPRQAVMTAIALFNRLAVTEADVEAFQAYDFKDVDLKVTTVPEEVETPETPENLH
jgi:hypothetical protein